MQGILQKMTAFFMSITANRDGCMDGCAAPVERIRVPGADGIIMNDVTLLPCVKA